MAILPYPPLRLHPAMLGGCVASYERRIGAPSSSQIERAMSLT
jgi:hypothetical protein